MATNFAPKHIAGIVVITQEIVRTNGTIANLTIEQYDNGFMFIVNGCTNRKLFATSRKAINAAAKTEC